MARYDRLKALGVAIAIGLVFQAVVFVFEKSVLYEYFDPMWYRGTAIASPVLAICIGLIFIARAFSWWSLAVAIAYVPLMHYVLIYWTLTLAKWIYGHSL